MGAREPVASNAFAAAAPAFLRALAAHNDREWFARNRQRYEREVLQPSMAFTVALGDAMARHAPSVVADPRVGGSLFRLQRDMRFATGGSPFKTHVGIRLRHAATAAGSRCEGPVMYVELGPDHLLLGVGVKEFDGGVRARWLAAIAAHARPFEYASALARKHGHAVTGALLVRAPKDFQGGPLEELARRRGLFIEHRDSVPASLHDAGLLAHCLRFFRPYSPLYEALGRLYCPPAARNS